MAANPYNLRLPKGGLRRQISFLKLYFKTNLLIGLEYRAAFISKFIGMIMNDVIWIIFWAVFFTRFPSVSGYSVRDTLALWVISALGFGWATAVCGNITKVASIIANGGLDFYLAVPKNVLFHLLISSMDVSAWGDIVFAVAMFAILYQPDPLLCLLILALGLLGGIIFLSFTLVAHSLAFFLGNVESLATQIMFSLITFSTYPSNLFRGIVKAILYTVIPAAFISYIPVELIRHFQPELFALMVLGTTIFATIAISVFYAGLRRYESGNLFQMRN